MKKFTISLLSVIIGLTLFLALFAICGNAQPPVASSLQSLSLDAMLNYYAPPAAIAPVVQPSTDPSVFMSDPNYIKGLNKQFFQHFSVEVPNGGAFDKYRFQLQNWAGPNGYPDAQHAYRTGKLPDAPVYVMLDSAKFDAWWLKYCITWAAGQDPPAVSFIVPVAPLPAAPVISAPVPPSSGSPIGADNGANIFRSSANDSVSRFGDGAIYQDASGTYIKHIYITPFGTTIFWNKVS